HLRDHGQPKIFIFQNEAELIGSLIRRWREMVLQAVQERGSFTVALSGGKTPVLFYAELAWQEDLPWGKTHVFLVDERFVPFNHRDSNYRLLVKTFLEKVKIPGENIHSIPVQEASAETAARRYEEDVMKSFRISLPGQWPEFDLVLLGIGEDGHTASLFPEHPALQETDRLAVAVILDEARHDRITLTLPVLNHALGVFFLGTGKNKAAMLARILEGRGEALPASRVRPKSGNLFFWLDREASSELVPALRLPAGMKGPH
ncbi:MAG: 6-phosphogluconolactonase, partial [Deltaproteobacteria bacterium]|nr:6-phosphogluconolactonase [Deltaproteobacteria bacterium]